MFVLALSMELHLPECRSLKERRSVVKPIVEGARHRFRVSAAEVAGGGTWQLATVGFAVVSGTVSLAESVMDDVERFVWSFPEVEVTGTSRRWLEAD